MNHYPYFKLLEMKNKDNKRDSEFIQNTADIVARSPAAQRSHGGAATFQKGIIYSFTYTH